jgi:hypothetical protein
MSMVTGSTPPGSPASQPGSPPSTSRGIWTAVFFIFGIIVGTASGWLAYASGRSLPRALLVGGGAFTTALLLCFAVYKFVRGETH